MASLVALCATALVVGCGGDDGDDVNNNADNYSGTEAEVAGVVDDLANAARDGDGSEVCDEIFTPEFAEFVENEADQTCASEIEENVPEGEYELEIESLEVDDDTATAGVTDQDDNETVLHLERVDGDWQVTRFTPSE
jgi:hypothetical protein